MAQLAPHHERIAARNRAQESMGAALSRPPTREERRARSRADSFRYDEQAEQYLALAESNPARFEALVTPDLRMQLGLYQRSKAAAVAAGDDVSPPE